MSASLEWRKINWDIFGHTWWAGGAHGITYEIDWRPHRLFELVIKLHGEVLSRSVNLPDLTTAQGLAQHYYTQDQEITHDRRN